MATMLLKAPGFQTSVIALATLRG